MTALVRAALNSTERRIDFQPLEEENRQSKRECYTAAVLSYSRRQAFSDVPFPRRYQADTEVVK
jgi:hypothetical protein